MTEEILYDLDMWLIFLASVVFFLVTNETGYRFGRRYQPYGCGLGGRRNFFVTAMASILIAAVILVIVDLDRPRRGLIRVSQQRMVDLRDSLAKE